MTNFTPEMVEKARAAKSADELVALAKENNVELTGEEAKIYFTQLNTRSGEISDEEFDNVAGGGCKSASGRTVVTSGCECFTGCYQPLLRDGCDIWQTSDDVVRKDNLLMRYFWHKFAIRNTCGSCRFLEFEGKTGVCGKS